jgi:hypothetical protein
VLAVTVLILQNQLILHGFGALFVTAIDRKW